MTAIRRKAISGIEVGDSFVVSRTFTEEGMRAFGELSQDFNPVHYSDRFAALKGFEGRICHGLHVGSLLTEVGGQIGVLAAVMDFRFKKPVYFGDTVECRFTVTELGERNRATAEAIFTNQDGEVVIEAIVKGIIPGEPEQEVLADL